MDKAVSQNAKTMQLLGALLVVRQLAEVESDAINEALLESRLRAIAQAVKVGLGRSKARTR